MSLGLLFFLVAAGAVLMTRVNGGISLIWPANAVAAALLIRSARVRWLTAGVALLAAGVAANLLVGQRAWSSSIVFAAINCAEIGATVGIFRFLARFPYPYISLGQGTIMTAVMGIAMPALAAIGGGAAVHGYYGVPLPEATWQWWSSHAVGACLVGPPIILGSPKALRRLASGGFLAENLAALLLVLLGCWLAVRSIQFPFVVVGSLLLMAAFRVGGFGAALLGMCSGFEIAALWSLGVRPAGLEAAPVAASLASLPVVALLATTMPPIAVGLGTDARRAAVRRLRASEQRFRESMDHSPIGMLIADLNGVWGYTNVALQKMLGYTAAELGAMPPGGPSDKSDWEQSRARRSRLLSGELHGYEVDRRFRHKSGRWVWTRLAVSLARDEDGTPLYLIAQIESLEERRRADQSLAEERERLRITLASITDAVITTDAEGRITYINEAGQRLLRQQLPDLEHRRLQEVIALTEARTSRSAANLIARSLVHGSVSRREAACVLHRPDGSACYVRDVISPIMADGGEVAGLVVVLQDADADVERERDLSHRASHDTLTNLANRFEFQRQLARAFARACSLERPAALLAIDLDRFKAVNDAAGHAAGDAVLRRVAEVLQLTVRQSDVVARLGGDEFAVILPSCPEERALHLGEQILRALNPLRVAWEGASHVIGASIGLAMLSPSFRSEADWMTASDQACYRAKNAGRGQLCAVSAAAAPPANSAARASRT